MVNIENPYTQLDAYQKYIALEERPDDISAFEVIDNQVVIPRGEVFCRYETKLADGRSYMCETKRKWASTTLSMHVKIAHGKEKVRLERGLTNRTNTEARILWESVLRQWYGAGRSGPVSVKKSPSQSSPLQQLMIFAKDSARRQTTGGVYRPSPRPPSPSLDRPNIRKRALTASGGELDEERRNERDASAHSRFAKEEEDAEKKLVLEHELEREKRALKDVQEEREQLQALLNIRNQVKQEREEVRTLRELLEK